MNHTYKTQFNQRTGRHIGSSVQASFPYRDDAKQPHLEVAPVIFISEHLSQQSTIRRLFNKTAWVCCILGTVMTVSSPNAFAVTDYHGDAALLVSSDTVGGNFDFLIKNSSVNGVIDLDVNGVPIPTSAEVLIDYPTGGTSVDFILSGYAWVNNDNTIEIAATTDNRVVLTQANIQTNIYAGLAHFTTVFNSIYCPMPDGVCVGVGFVTELSNKTLIANSNSLEVQDQGTVDVAGDIYVGLAGLNITYKNMTAGELIDTSMDIWAEGDTLNSNENTVSIYGAEHVFSNVYAGFSAFNVMSSDLAVGTLDYMASINVNISVNDGTWSSNDNRITVLGTGHTFADVSAGSILNQLSYADLGAGASITSSSDAVAEVNIINYMSSGGWQSDNNSIVIEGTGHVFEEVSVGSVVLDISRGNITTNEAFSSDLTASASSTDVAYYASNTLSSSHNSIAIDGEGHSFADMRAGLTAIDIHYGDVSIGMASAPDKTYAFAYVLTFAFSDLLTSDANSIAIAGLNHTVNDLTAGHAQLNIQYGDITAGTIYSDNGQGLNGAVFVFNALNTSLSASNNNISLIGSSTVNGSIHTGYIDFIIDYGTVKTADDVDGSINIYLMGTAATAINNTINIDGDHHFIDVNASIYAGYLNYNSVDDVVYLPETYDVFTGNTLNYANLTAIAIGQIANFQTYNFTLNPAFANTGTPMISANRIVLGSNASNISDGSVQASDVYVVAIHPGQLIAADSKFILMQADPGQLTGLGQGHSGTVVAQVGTAQQGISVSYDVETQIDLANDQVIAMIRGEPQVNPQLKALLEGNLSSLALLADSADHIANDLLPTIQSQSAQNGLIPVMMMSANQTQLNSGSMIKSKGVSLLGGLSIQGEQWTLGLFSENSWGSYDSYNTFEDAAAVHGQGTNRLNGGVLYGHYDFEHGWYADGSLRGGYLRTEFSSNDISNAATGEIAEYTVKRKYWGTHVGGGYIAPLNENNKLDLNFKYLMTRMQGVEVLVAGDPMNFDQITSQRFIAHLENHYQVNPQLSVLAGLGFEYEFDGQAQGSTYEISNIDQPSVKGSTGVASVGVHYQPATYDHLSLDLSANGYWGKREGGSVMLNLAYTF